MIREALKNLPKTLDDTYTRLFLEIDEAYRKEAKNALSWLVFAGRPLYLTELAEAIIINPQADPPFDPEERFPDPQNVLEILSSLITISSSRDRSSSDPRFAEQYVAEDVQMVSTITVRLAHFSVKEYLTSDRIKNSQAQYFAIADVDSHNTLATSCLSYILHYCNSIPKTRLFTDLYEFPLLEYASKGWYFHLHFLPVELKKLLTPRALELLLSEFAMSRFLDIHVPGDTGPPTTLASEDLKIYTTNPLCNASSMGLFHVMEELLALGHDPNPKTKFPPLHRAVQRRFDEIVYILLESGAAPNTKDDDGFTPLHWAAVEGNTFIVRKLLEYGGKINATNESGETPLWLAAYNNQDSIVRRLVEAGAEVDCCHTVLRQTPFHWAAWNKNAPLMAYLLEHGANINAQNCSGETALHYAAKLNAPILRDLLDHGANLEVETNQGETPLYWAASAYANKRQPIDILLKARANIVQPLLMLAKNGFQQCFHQLLVSGFSNSETALMTRLVLLECARLGYHSCTRCNHMLSEHFDQNSEMKEALTTMTLDNRS